MNFENAPFKLTSEFVNMLGGTDSKMFARFRKRMIEGYKALNKHADNIMVLVEKIVLSQADMPCFEQGVDFALKQLRMRLYPTGKKSDLTSN